LRPCRDRYRDILIGGRARTVARLNHRTRLDWVLQIYDRSADGVESGRRQYGMQTGATKLPLDCPFDNAVARSSSDRVHRELRVPGAPVIEASPLEGFNHAIEQRHVRICGLRVARP
jgi:hypothetical protein